MKSIIVILISAFLLTCSPTIFAQSEISKKLTPFKIESGKFSLMIGKSSGTKKVNNAFDFTLYGANHWSIGFENNNLKYSSEFIPSNYTDGGLFLDLVTPNPKDRMSVSSFSIGSHYATRNKKIRVGGEVGISRLTLTQAKFEKNPAYDSAGGLSFIPGLWILEEITPSHNVTFEEKKATGLKLQARLDFALSKHFGFGFSAYTNRNKMRSFSGGAISLNFGIL